MAKLGEYGEQLPNMTEQEVFNVGCDHLLTQNEKSMISISTLNHECLYKGSDDLCCAAAPFIVNYKEEMEGKDWNDMVLEYNQSSNCKNLILNLQGVHDCYPVKHWPKALEQLAKSRQLELTNLLIEKLKETKV